MSFFDRFKRNKKKEEPTVIEISTPGLIRQVLHDGFMGDAEELAEAMGLPPVSDEVHEMEHEESDRRLEEILPLLPILQIHASIMGEAAMAAYGLTHPEVSLEEDEEELDSLRTVFKLLAFSSTVSAMSMLKELDIVGMEKEDN